MALQTDGPANCKQLGWKVHLMQCGFPTVQQHNVKQGLTQETEHIDGQPYQMSDDNRWTSLQGDAWLEAYCKAGIA